MRNRWKVLVLCLMMAAAVLLEPVSYARAEEEDSADRFENHVPSLNSSKISISKKEFKVGWFWKLLGLYEEPEEWVINGLVLSHYKVDGLDYSLYELVCDFELKTQTDNGIITSNYNYVIDGSNLSNVLLDDFVSNMITEDNYYRHMFLYRSIVNKAEGFLEEDVTGEGDYIYNTVVSKADFYFVRKSDGLAGTGKRFEFTWDSDFWMQRCVKISFSRFDPDSDIVKEVESVENTSGVLSAGGSSFDSDEDIWKQILDILIDIPGAIVAIVEGFFSIFFSISDLFKATFPFIPGVIFDIFSFFILLTILVAVYKIVLGK